MAETAENEGNWVVRRKITIPLLQHCAGSSGALQVLSAIPGVRKADVDAQKGRVVVQYDTRVADFASVADTLELAGYPRAKGRWSRLREGWFRFVDSNMRENASAPRLPAATSPPDKGHPANIWWGMCSLQIVSRWQCSHHLPGWMVHGKHFSSRIRRHAGHACSAMHSSSSPAAPACSCALFRGRRYHCRR